MASKLQRLLGNDDALFRHSILKLEASAGNKAHDVRLLAEITHEAHRIMRSLRLDPADTHAEELYLALNAAVQSGFAERLLEKSDFVLLEVDDEVISFALLDVVENSHHALPFAKRSVSHARRALRGELVERYVQDEQTDDESTKALAQSAGLIRDEDSEHREYRAAAKPSSDAPYILAIGDIVTDAFIKLREDMAEVTTDENGKRRLSMEFGNKPPYEQVDIVQAVGNSANAAVAFTRLGLRAGLMAFIGDDQPGKDSLAYLASENVDTRTVSVQKGFKSNYHYALRYGADRTILIKYEDYSYDWQEPVETPDWLYLSMLSESSWQLHMDMMRYLEQHPETKLVFQPGTFHFAWGADKLAAIYRRSHIVFMNREEAMEVTGRGYDSIKDLADGLHELGCKIVVITDGPNGAYASESGKVIRMPNYPDPAPPYDRTGAGDAFASTVTAALAMGESLETALTWAPINSMSVVQQLGAQAGLLHKPDLENYLADAPDDYTAEEYTK